MPALLLVLITAACVRLWRLGTQVITSDESFSWRLSGYGVGEIAERTAADVHSPLFYVLLKGWLAIAGTSVLGLRAPAVILTVAVVALGFHVVRTAAGGALAGPLLTAVFLAVHPLQVQQGRNGRMYGLGLVLVALATLVSFRAVRDPGAGHGRWATFGVLSALLVYTHYYGAFTVAALGMAALVLAGREGLRRTARGLAVAAVVTLALLAPWLPAMLSQARRVQQDYWIPTATSGSVGAAVLHWATGLQGGPAIAVALAAVALVTVAARREPRLVAFFALPAVLPWFLALAASALSERPLLIERFTVFAHLGFALLLGVASSVARPRPALAVAGALLLLGGPALGLVHELKGLSPERPALQQAVDALGPRYEDGDVVVAESPRLLNKLLFYWAAARGLPLRARCLPTDLADHYSHAAALGPDDVLRHDVADLHVRRVWRLSERAAALPSLPGDRWTPAVDELHEGGQGTVIRLVRHDRR